MSRRSTRRWSIAVMASAAMVGVACAPPPDPPGPPTTIVVTTTADVFDGADGLISLREAFVQASGDNADSTIIVGSGLEYPLTRCDLGGLQHQGGLALRVTTDGVARATVRQTCSPARVMTLSGSAVRLERLSIRGGRVQSPTPCGIAMYLQPPCERGAGIDTYAPITLDDVELTDNRSIGSSNVEGGGLSARASATIVDSDLTDNVASRSGGAIAAYGPLTIQGSNLSGNTAGEGGAIAAHSGAVVIEGSTLESNGGGSGGAIVLANGSLRATDTVLRANNSGGGPGAAIWADSAVSALVLERVAVVSNSGRTGAITTFAGISDYRIVDSTITDNVATTTWRDIYNRAAGGLAFLGASTVHIVGSTIAHNTAASGGGANLDLPPANGTTVLIESSIVSDPQDSPDNCFSNGNLFTVVGSLIDDDTCGAPAAPSGPLLGALTSGSGTWFRAPGPGSPVIDALGGPCATAADKRGVIRPQGAACDQGAIES